MLFAELHAVAVARTAGEPYDIPAAVSRVFRFRRSRAGATGVPARRGRGQRPAQVSTGVEELLPPAM